MNRRTFMYGTALASAKGALAKAAPGAVHEETLALPQSKSQKRIQRAVAAAMAMQRRDWEQGTLAQALLEAGDRQRVILLTRAAMAQSTPDRAARRSGFGQPDRYRDGWCGLRQSGAVDRR